jgi:hypothetical protein
LVGPGEHVLLAPLDFRGKQIALVSRAGPEETTLRLDAGAPAEAASVVIFRGGEGRGARLTGFTISGGRGTQRLARRDGGDPGGAGRRGGGILIESSSPTIAGNVITGNGATQGLGGGIHVEGGSPAITGNVVSGNWAGSGGGLAASGHARDGDAGPWMFDGNSFSGNVAERGGAVYIEGPARVELTHTLLAGNFASERGGAIYIDSGASLRIDRTTMVFNKALGSSGVLRADTGGVAAITSSVLWGNAPARVEAPISYSLLERAPDGSAAEGSLASGNRAAFPLFVDPAGEWQVAPAPPEFSGKSWPGRWVGGDYHLLPGSPAIDVGDPHAAADPDDTPADAGAFYLEQPLRAFVRGDVGGDGAATWADVALLARHLVAREPLRCLDAADLDDSGSVGPIDAVRLGLYLLTGRLAPAPPFPDCGLDPTFGEGLSCVRKADPCRPEGSP